MPDRATWFGSLHARLAWIVFATVVPILAGLSFYLQRQHDALLRQSLDSVRTTTLLAAQYQRNLLSSTAGTLEILAHAPTIQRGAWSTCERYFARIVGNRPQYANLGVIGVDGQVLCSARPARTPLQRHLADRGYFQHALASSEAVVGEYQIGRITGEPALVVAKRIEGPDGRPRGVIYVALALQSLQARTANGIRGQARLIVLDRNNAVLLATPQNSYQLGARLAVPAMLATGSERAMAAAEIEQPGHGRWYAARTSAGPPGDPAALSIMFETPLDELRAEARRTTWVGIGASALLCMLTLAGGWLLTQVAVGRNVRLLTSAVKRFARQDFSARVGSQMSGPEFREIGGQFDQMAEGLDTNAQRLSRSSARRAAQSEVLRLIADNTPLGRPLARLAGFVQEHLGCPFAAIIASYNRQAPLVAASGPLPPALRELGAPHAADVPPASAAWRAYQDGARAAGLPPCWSRPVTSRSGEALGAIAIHRDVDQPLSDEEEIALQVATDLAAVAIEKFQIHSLLEFQATYDALTGLLNRNMLAPRIEQAIAACTASSSGFALAIVNLDGFKEINDTLGHAAGDALLRQTASRLRQQLDPADTLVRVGGDEFAAVLRSASSHSVALLATQRLLNCLHPAFDAEQAQVRIAASAGLALFPRDGANASDLLRHADIALFQAKREGISLAVFDPAEGQRLANKVLLMAALREAVANGEFELYYQPKIALPGRQPIGFEALARWRHPQRGILAPAEFMELIEVSELIHPFTTWVIEAAIAQCTAWQARGLAAGVAINISTRNLLDISLPDRIQDCLQRHKLAPHWLTLEITESAVMADPARSLDVLTRLADIGSGIAIDDFGTGYSSLAYLQKLPVDSLKIDRSFVHQMAQDRDGLAIVSSVIELAHALHVSVVAEGVESEQTLRKLGELNCDCAQGYFIARPMPAADALDWLLTRQATV